jgi:hypothetical protein
MAVHCLPNLKPKYIALSYVWGDEAIGSPISINNETTSITTNLDRALRNLWRKGGEEVLVWADAICINQADDVEKASQVRMMGDIYSNGMLVLEYRCAWHGSEPLRSN